MYRRQFLITIASTTGALVLGCAPSRRTAPGEGGFAPSAFLRIDPDGSVTVTVARAEMGQGSRTALALLVAEELDADWSRVRVEQGDLDARYGEQFAGGSAVVRTSWEPLRHAGAAARAMLVSAAATRWGVPPAQCTVENGRVSHAAKGSVDFGALVDAAGRLPVPAPVELKPPGTFRFIGKGRPNLDHPAIVTGQIEFGLDTRVPGMLYAVIARAPVFGARVARVDDAKARALPGVRNVVAVDADALPPFGENCPRPANGVAVIAGTTWAALQGRAALSIEWDERGGQAESTAGLRAAAMRLAGGKDQFVTAVGGDVDAALARSAHRLESVYETPLLAHAPMEPMNCTASVTAGRCEVWAPTQNPEYVGRVAALITGLAPSQITVHVTRMGGAFGRRFYADYAAEAVLLSKAVQAPVQVLWTREDDLGHGFYRPAGYHLLRGGIDS
ncbi:MAG TPA: molybdopterin cofactor-binding domain-containing protein, partial [Gemmatimonadales bacterium]|nr:molybdopterin cofactor-binding domain-containing protein [Gemmatimonadales bacterium]